jgi:hypothetical protein
MKNIQKQQEKKQLAITEMLKEVEYGTITLSDISNKSLDASIIKSPENAELIKKILKKNGLFLSKILFSDFTKWDDLFDLWRPSIITAVQQNGAVLQYTNQAFKQEPWIVIQAVSKESKHFLHTSEGFRKNSEYIKNILELNGLILQYLNDGMKNDREMIEIAIMQNPNAIQYIPEKFRTEHPKDYEKILVMGLATNGLSLKYANDDTKNNKGMIQIAIMQNPDAIQYISEKFRTEHPDYYENILVMALEKNGLALKYVPEEIQKNNIGLVMTAVNQHGQALHEDIPEFRDNISVVSFAVLNDGTALDAASERIKNDESTVILAIKQNPLALRFASEEIQNNPSTKILDAINFQSPHANSLLRQITNEKILLEIVTKNPELLTALDGKFKGSRKFLAMLLEKNWTIFEYFEKKFKNDPALINIAFKQNISVLEHVSPELRNNTIYWPRIVVLLKNSIRRNEK